MLGISTRGDRNIGRFKGIDRVALPNNGKYMEKSMENEMDSGMM